MLLPTSFRYQLDRTNPLSRGLLGCYGLNHVGKPKVFDYVTYRDLKVTNINNSTAKTYADGYMFRKNNTTSMSDQDVAIIPSITRSNMSFTIVQHCKLYDVGSAYRAFASVGGLGNQTYTTFNTGGSGGGCQLWWGHASGGTTSANQVSVNGVSRSFVAGASHKFGVGANGVKIFVNGRPKGTGTSHTGSLTYTFNRVTFGGLTYNAGNISGRESQNGVALFLWYDRALSDAELALITQNPYRIFNKTVS